jgi:predicted dehydrogenase
MNTLRIAVIGIGHQGRNHLRFLRSLDGVRLSLVIDRDAERAAHAGGEFQTAYAESYLQHLSEFDAAIIAVPTVDHFQIATELIKAGKHVLIEKPVASSVEEANQLTDLARGQGIVAHVGFPERFNPAVENARKLITHPLFIETHRLGVFSPRSLDVDVVMDLMIHDLDLLHLFLAEYPSQIEAVGIPILSQKIDIANARLKFPGKCVVNLTASRVSAKRMRKMRLFQAYSYISIDFVDQSVSMFSLQPNACFGGLPQITQKELKSDKPQHPLDLELQAFRNHVLQGIQGGVSISDAIPSLKMALSIKQGFSPSHLELPRL